MQLTDKGLRTGAPGRYGVGNLIRVLVLSLWFLISVKASYIF